MRIQPASDQTINVFWFVGSNVGDALTPWLIEKITGKQARFVPYQWPEHKFMVTGSIIRLANEHCTVWGCGIPWADEQLDPKANVVAARGPLTQKRIIDCGGSCEVVGDPALLLPRFYQPNRGLLSEVGLAPHVIDRDRVFAAYRGHPLVKLIDLDQSPEQVIDAIVSCKRVLSSSLHGMIMSFAYGVPSRWVEFSDRVIGDGTKFRDFMLSVAMPVQEPVDLRSYHPSSPRQWQYGTARVEQPIVHRCYPPVTRLIEIAEEVSPVDLMDTTALWESCPFRP